VLVERLLEELRALAGRDDRAVRLLRRGPALRAEQDLAAPELGLGHVAARGVARHQFVETRQRAIEVAFRLVGARQLVQHGVGARIVRLLREQARVQLDGAARLRRARTRDRCLGALGVAGLELEVAEAAQRLGAQRRVAAGQVEEATVQFAGPRRVGRDGFALAQRRLQPSAGP
jgi:hypothetical protein